MQTAGRVTHFVAILGTSGTFVGTSRKLKELNPAIRCISLQPDSPFHGIEGAKHMETSIIPRFTMLASQTRRWASKQKQPPRWPKEWPGKKAC
jgi:cysteine synthase